MPYIKKIKIRGFKSFGPKNTTIQLNKGFTVFTGPNGSGKTNIVDAVLFGLGELSPRRLRSDGLARLIFTGSTDKAKFAEVALQFDNSDHRLPIDTSTVTVSRLVSKNGQSTYKLNGRRVTRSRIIDMLSMAGIGSGGHNVIMQGTVTGIAEISSYERRRIIEDLIGIAQYDSEKDDAEEKLQKAEISIQTAMGRIDEVQKRVDALERERNALLRYDFIKSEIRRFKAIKVSYELLVIEQQMEDLSLKIKEVESKVDKLNQVREELRSQRYTLEGNWRRFSSETVDAGGNRVLEVQIKIGDLKSRITELTTKIDVGKSSISGLKRIRENSLQKLEAITNEISEAKKEVRQLKTDLDPLNREVTIHQDQYDSFSTEITQTRKGLSKQNQKVQEIEQNLDSYYQQFSALRGDYARSKANVKALSNSLKDQETRKNRFMSTLNELERSLTDLTEVKKEHEERFRSIHQVLGRRATQKQAVIKEIAEAGRVAKSARETMLEFNTQRELADKVASEEKALRKLEELGSIGALEGVYGRIRNIILIKREYEKAIEAASAGWLDSILVKDCDAALACAETLKRLKLGRVKIIPLQEVSAIKPVTVQDVEGIIGNCSTFIQYSKRYEPAVNFIFGDTVLTKDEQTALVTSRKGYRTVTVNGDLFESGGGIESGYFRTPIDFFSIIPSDSALKSLDHAVKALHVHLTRREGDLTVINEEIDESLVETARLSEATSFLTSEFTRVQRNLKRAKQNIKSLTRNIHRSREHLKKAKAQMVLYKTQSAALQKEIRNQRTELAFLRQKVSPSQIQEIELQREKLGAQINELQQMIGHLQTNRSSLKFKLDNVFKVNYENLKIELKKVEQQLSTTEKDVEEALIQRQKIEEELLGLEHFKQELSRSVLTAKKETKKFTLQIDDVDKRLRSIDAEYEQANGLFHQLRLQLQTFQLQSTQLNQSLAELDYEKPLPVLPEQLAESESSRNLMQFELERLGAVNQLAPLHYADQISRYKELSIRMNELEREKQAIILFMDELEMKKRRVFMDAFNRINESFSVYFSKLTGGGEAALKLESVDDPFSSGVDMIVQFPAKPPIIVSGASGGERSVAAVAFISALQDFMPAAFYIFDEVDAHLDSFHTGRLGELLNEESTKTQFLVISLKPEMVSKARSVYGVYENNGVSNVISTTFLGTT